MKVLKEIKRANDACEDASARAIAERLGMRLEEVAFELDYLQEIGFVERERPH